MRNLLVYPVRPDEVVFALKRAYDEAAAQELCGSLDPMILLGVFRFFQDPLKMNELLEQMKVKTH